jgi:hypothetical protein
VILNCFNLLLRSKKIFIVLRADNMIKIHSSNDKHSIVFASYR